MTEYTPDEMTAREMYLAGSTLYRETPEQHYLGAPEPDYRAEFERFLARVKCDAAREALTGLAESSLRTAEIAAARGDKEWERDARFVAREVIEHRNARYPEEAP